LNCCNIRSSCYLRIHFPHQQPEIEPPLPEVWPLSSKRVVAVCTLNWVVTFSIVFHVTMRTNSFENLFILPRFCALVHSFRHLPLFALTPPLVSMGPSRRTHRVTQTTSPVEVSVFTATARSGGQQEAKSVSSSSEAQRRYSGRLCTAGEAMSKALEDMEKAQQTQYHTLLRTVLDPLPSNPQNGITPLSRPEKQEAAAAAVV
jgi:hypothetical protein